MLLLALPTSKSKRQDVRIIQLLHNYFLIIGNEMGKDDYHEESGSWKYH